MIWPRSKARGDPGDDAAAQRSSAKHYIYIYIYIHIDCSSGHSQRSSPLQKYKNNKTKLLLRGWIAAR